MKSRRDIATGEAGTTILEALFAIGALLVGMVGIFGMAEKSIESRAFARIASGASSLARDKMEDLRAAPFATVTSGADPMPLDANGAGNAAQSIYVRSWSVTGGPTANTKEIAVTVSWGDGPTRKISLKSILLG